MSKKVSVGHYFLSGYKTSCHDTMEFYLLSFLTKNNRNTSAIGINIKTSFLKSIKSCIIKQRTKPNKTVLYSRL